MRQEKIQYEFSADKNRILIEERQVSFEEIIAAISNEGLLDVLEHPNKTKYPNQQIYVININGYVNLVPFIQKNPETIFLKTIFPSRKLTKLYLGNEDDNHE